MYFVEPWIDGFGVILCQPVVVASAPRLLDDIKDVVGVISSAVTAIAVLFGGGWAYFKFARGRTFKPRLSVRVEGQWRRVSRSPVLYVRISVNNVGATKFALKQHFSALEVSFPDGGTAAQEVTWDPVRYVADDVSDREDSSAASMPSRKFIVFGEHDWFEPGETVYDDLLLDLNRGPEVVKLEVSLVGTARLKSRYSLDTRRDTEVFARTIIAPDTSRVDRLIQQFSRRGKRVPTHGL